ncbi:hypothetical protein A9G45_11750 [Gilliamella sp. HK2]|uniref:hypothetical protein n=1 Tax=unclassified Gilliamella TaxID=2685620 RepID=UPI00080E363C|nr:hypothetical protein [Gilliamella apicola]OCG28511.1 hypothetical protein A9G46_02265 [Gilliamella apicola]OCG32530.1 hypothetical protein A9G45_11750 [Gilliamella apicola]
MNEIKTSTEYEHLVAEFKTYLELAQWNERNFFDEFYDNSNHISGERLNPEEIRRKYDAFRKAKTRNNINIYALKEYIKFMQNHDVIKNKGYIYANYIHLGDDIKPSTKKMLENLSKEYTNKVMSELD